MTGTEVSGGRPVAAVRAVPAFVRFVVFGGGVTLLGSGALLLVGDRAPVAAANAVVTVVTTLLATELHTRFTFRRGRAGWSDHCASGLTVLLSYLFTTGALLGYDALHTGNGALVRQGVYLAASGAAGIARFLLLRYVFARTGRTRRAQSPTARDRRTAWAGRGARAGRAVRSVPAGWAARTLRAARVAALFARAVPTLRPVVAPLAVPAAVSPALSPAVSAVRVAAVIPSSVRPSSPPAVTEAVIAATVPGARPELWTKPAVSSRESASSRPRMLVTSTSRP
jgi:putative flippase GtrA